MKEGKGYEPDLRQWGDHPRRLRIDVAALISACIAAVLVALYVTSFD